MATAARPSQARVSKKSACLAHRFGTRRDAARVDRTVEDRHVVGLVREACAGLLDQLHAQPRRGRRQQVAVLELERLAHQLLAPRHVHGDGLEDREVRDCHRSVQRHRIHHRADGVVRRDRDEVRVGEVGDALGLAEPAGMRDVRLQDVDRLLLVLGVAGAHPQQNAAMLQLRFQEIRVVVAERIRGRQTPHIIGRGVSESKGLRHGYIVNVHDTIKSLKRAVAQAEESAGTAIRQAYLAIGGVSLEGIAMNGNTIVTRADAVITELDMKRAHDAAESAIPQSIIQNRKIIQARPEYYKLDKKRALDIATLSLGRPGRAVALTTDEDAKERFKTAISLLSKKTPKKKIIEAILEDPDKAYPLFAEIIAKLADNPIKNYDILRSITERMAVMSQFSVNKRLQIETALWNI